MKYGMIQKATKTRKLNIKMLENRPNDVLGKLVNLVNLVKLVKLAKQAEWIALIHANQERQCSMNQHHFKV